MKAINKYKIVVMFIALASFSFVFQSVSATSDHGTLDEVIASIAEAHSISVSDIRDIDCEVFSSDELESLGDAVMQEMVGDTERHEFMDEMMGGEGSASLRAMHEHMARAYLGCANGAFGNGMMFGGMMNMMGMGGNGSMMRMMMPQGGTGMMPIFGGSNFPNSNSMMGFSNNMMGAGSGFGALGMGGIFSALLWAILIIGVIFIVVKLAKQSSSDKNGRSEKTAFHILKERYAKGEIDKKEFEDKKRDIM